MSAPKDGTTIEAGPVIERYSAASEAWVAAVHRRAVGDLLVTEWADGATTSAPIAETFPEWPFDHRTAGEHPPITREDITR